MAPFICQVLDADGGGLAGMHARIQCFHKDATVDAFYSKVEDNGRIEMWSPAGSQELIFVDTVDYERISLQFSTALYFGRLMVPWHTISTELVFASFLQHIITLQFGQDNLNFRLTHTAEPRYSSSADSEGIDSQSQARQDELEIESNSTPLIDRPPCSATPLCSLVLKEKQAVAGKKRKLDVDHYAERPSKVARYS
ncbi:hypothetical protein V8F33_008496 [Rhypophila sp. PSN 637]